ncbi:MAG TPA: Asp-tRNA(Asn)/Glu-tRNA(Gln) amidotransferase subunit GatC [Thermoanaerobaculia bacterium]|nr:Asp-tRNA(Asn)/Glu-tRNA(Gln) amidotransferase subunit GatC [Thermoanaerobaculia bacterium]
MALTTEEVRKIASLARLRFTPDEEAAFAGQLGKIVDYIDQLQRFEAGAPPAAATGAAASEVPPAPLPLMAPPLPPLPPSARAAPEDDDLPRPCLPRESFLANAPATLDGFLLVPEVRRTSTADARQAPAARPGVGDDRSS